MADRTYPYTAWTLKPSFKPVQVTLVRAYASLQYQNTWDVSESGRFYSIEELFPTKQAAIDAGWERIHEQEASLSKRQASIYKKREALAKAAEEQQ